MVDYRINLAKTVVSTSEQRRMFYNGMLIYLVTCAAAMVFVAYLSSINIKRFLETHRERGQILSTATAVSRLDVSAFKNPGKSYADLQVSSEQIAALKQALGQCTHLLPVVHNLFSELPDGVLLQSLSADRHKMSFDLEMPPPSEGAGDPVRKLRRVWEKNDELMKSVSSIRPVKGERRTVGGESKFYYKFECVFNR